MINRPAIHLTSPRGCADKPSYLSQIAMSMVSILGHCDKRPTADQRVAEVEIQTAHILADSWRIVPEV